MWHPVVNEGEQKQDISYRDNEMKFRYTVMQFRVTGGKPGRNGTILLSEHARVWSARRFTVVSEDMTGKVLVCGNEWNQSSLLSDVIIDKGSAVKNSVSVLYTNRSA